jgi:hypothetical protein
VKVEKIVSTILLEKNKITTAPVAIAIAEAV